MAQEDSWTTAMIEKWLVSRLAALTGTELRSIDVGERFSRYGLDSLGANRLLAELGAELGRQLPATLIWGSPTIRSLAEAVSVGAQPAARQVSSPAAASRTDDPVAVVGMSCRFPQADGLDAYWSLLSNGVDAVSDVPKGRWDTDALYDQDPSAPGKVSSRWGGFLDRIDGFDPQFFGISPREAAEMDPQQRLSLELAWEALDNAGIAPHSLRDSRTGVFFGAMWHDYAQFAAGAVDRITQHTATGHDLSIIPARIAYFLGLRGPVMTLNTACSSALVAMHQARQSILLGESSVALVGGISLLVALDSMVAMSRFGAMAPDGRCKAFDSRANGYVRGEGGGVVVLKPLSRALADGNPVYCVLRGSAVNNDGFSNGLTAPSPAAQEQVLRDAYANAGVDPAQVDYVETHGTGTMLGDPIEAGALGAVLGAGRPADRSLILGSVKTNIGHLEAAAGIAGFIKTALSLRHRSIPPSLHFEEPNPHIDFEASRLRVASSRTAWPEREGPALAGVSAFGFGGTNCHVVLERPDTDDLRLVPVAASSPAELRSAVAELREACDRPEASLPELCSAAQGSAFEGPHRIAVTASGVAELVHRLDGYLDGRVLAGTATGEVSEDRPKPVFLFAGQGSQWLNMGKDLLPEPAFRASLQRTDRAMRPYLDASIMDVLLGNDPAWLDDVPLVQPAIFAVQVALADLWRSWGVQPGAVAGQSMGEVAAAHVAQCLSLADAVRIICVRSRIVRDSVAGRGGMAVVELPAEETRRLIARRSSEVSIAVSSSPTATVISGAADAVEDVASELTKSGITVRRIQVDYASHSPQMEPLLPELRSALSGLRPHLGAVPFYSTVTGGLLSGTELNAGYWCDNLREPVLFAETVRLLIDSGHDRFIDVNPHPIVMRNVAQCLSEAGRQGQVLPTMRRAEPGRSALLDSLGSLYCQGQDVNWQRVHPSAGKRTGSPAAEERDTVVLPLSAHTPDALAQGADELAGTLRGGGDLAITDVAFTATHRARHPYRLAVVGDSRDELANALERAAKRGPELVRGKPPVVFVFSGHGAAWSGMGRELVATEPVFRRALGECDAAIQQYAEFSVLEFLQQEQADSEIGRVEHLQPALFAMEVAFAALWRSWGIEPDAVVGQSMGEVAAAHVAGALSLQDAARIICLRSALLGRIRGQGAMALVELSLPDARDLVDRWGGQIEIAASNSPTATLLTGDHVAIEKVLADLDQEGVFGRQMVIDVASHSRQVKPLLAELRSALRDIEPTAGAVPFCSSVTGEVCDGADLDASYWVRNLREPVMFAPATTWLSEQGYQVFLEVSPHPILAPAIEETLHSVGAAGTAIATAHKRRGDRADLLEAVAALFTAGREVDWDRVQPEGGRTVPLPSYPWQRERYWLDCAPAWERRTQAEMVEGVEQLPGPRTAPTDEAVPVADSREAVEDHLTDRVAQVLHLPPDEVPRDVQLSALGMSSLMAMELRNLLLRDLAVTVPVSLVLRAAGISALAAEAFALMGSEQPAVDAGVIVDSMDRIEI
ncbi:myxalamid-type polyketide synthase MxaF [Saccharopolyspora erythraea NRRL 2338]|uniref:Modular polyketide synthase n=2 Tax=Saccharopolyspora erythraea TaxID=1836 RepID=A4FCY0_SACEN|nr:type I polyketide synthase [Saccharopolyspora erythraea]EQD82443.1 polyketide synthase [Saccharopolyspora erythraea D]PFG95654.1 myxalamid-type polyketide synthase MxaF [Saccharopolyspora erythraea NRRL 2338]QRK92255.1 acyltransferase domain-containing protein [Saccharopolyspora erythraea]CAM01905.1 modular polyketide synthase [Saccharopolyspora erythraea NRRL 2338]